MCNVPRYLVKHDINKQLKILFPETWWGHRPLNVLRMVDHLSTKLYVWIRVYLQMTGDSLELFELTVNISSPQSEVCKSQIAATDSSLTVCSLTN